MTIFVDQLINYPKNLLNSTTKKHGVHWCHMWCDGDIDELHHMASKIGLKKSYFQISRVVDHYDLVPSKRNEAIKNGAVEIPLKRWLQNNKNKK